MVEDTVSDEGTPLKVLVAYASRHGSTAGIARAIAERLVERGLDAFASDVEAVTGATEYDAYVVGSAAYMFHWLKPARRFVYQHQDLLREHPLWLFSSGPLGEERTDAEGNDLLEESRPREFAELSSRLNSLGEKVFFGAWDPDSAPVGFGEWAFRSAPISKDLFPAGDFRDWVAIAEWADEIADSLLAKTIETAESAI